MTTHMTSLGHSATPGKWRTEFERIYAAPQYRRACQARRDPKQASWLVELVAGAFDTLQEWHKRAQSRRLLGSLDEHMRKDLGFLPNIPHFLNGSLTR